MKKKAISIGLVLMLLLTLLPVVPAQAASTPKLNKTNVMVGKGKTVTLKVKNTSKKVTWSSSKKSVATVSKNGKVTGKKIGTAKITAKVGKTKLTCDVTITDNININDYVSGRDFSRFQEYALAKGAINGAVSSGLQQVTFFYDNWYVEVSTNFSSEVKNYGTAYIGVVDPNDNFSMPYVCSTKFSGKDIKVMDSDRGKVYIPKSTIPMISKLINYMKAHPNPQKTPKINGMTFVTWSNLYQDVPR